MTAWLHRVSSDIVVRWLTYLANRRMFGGMRVIGPS